MTDPSEPAQSITRTGAELGRVDMENVELRRRMAVAREALVPFAKADMELPSPEEWNAACKRDGHVISFPAEDKDALNDWNTSLTVGDLRTATRALAALDEIAKPKDMRT